MKKALFLDRDGVINIDYGYVGKIEDFKFRDGIFELTKYFSDKGYDIFVVTKINQELQEDIIQKRIFIN